MIKTRILCLALLMTAFSWGAARADEIRLQNGDRLTGAVIRMEGGRLVFKTSYAGEIKLPWSQVVRLVTDKSIITETTDGLRARGRLAAAENGRATVKATDGMHAVALKDIAAINPQDKDALRIQGQVNLGADIRHGNTSKTNYDADGRIQADWGRIHRLITGLESHRETNKGKDTVDKDLAYIEYDRFISEKWYGLANLRGSQDQFKDINLRLSGGLGLGYQFWRSEQTNLSVELGPNWTYEEGDEQGSRDWLAARWALNYDRYFFDKLFQLFHRQVLFARMNDLDQTYFETRTGVRIPIRGGLAAVLQYNYDWDNSPAPGKEKTDSRFLVKLGYSW